MKLKLGLCGSHRTGKTTLAEAISQELGIPFVKTDTARVFRQNGLEPSGSMDFKTRLHIQHSIIAAAQDIWNMENGPFITDRTPVDMMAYTLGDIRGDTPADFSKLENYLAHCFDAANKTFTMLIIIQPAIPLIYEQGKAALNRAYMEHLNTLILGLCGDEQLRCPSLVITRAMTDIGERVRAVGNAVNKLVGKGFRQWKDA